MLRHSFDRKVLLAGVVALAVLGPCSAVFAHVGDHSHLSVAEGLTHPLTSIDHMLAMVAVGLWASLLWRLAKRIPVRFTARTVAGAIIAIAALPLFMP